MAKKVETTKILVSSRMSGKVGLYKDAPWYTFECTVEKSMTGFTDEEVQSIIDKAYETVNDNVDKQFKDACDSNKQEESDEKV